MSNFEIIQLAISLATFLTVLISVFFLYKQLLLIVKTHADNHELQRRSLTEQVLTGIRGADTYLLNELLGYGSNSQSGPIPKEKILEAFSKEPEAQDQCHRLLNYYDNMAHGIFLGTYDEKTIKANRHGSMKKTFNLFRAYINYRRECNYLFSGAWSTTERLLKKWDDSDHNSNTSASTGHVSL